MVVASDTLKFLETLREAGVPEAQAKAMSQAMRDAHETAEPVAGRDLRDAAMTIGTEIHTLRAELRAIELRLTIRLGRHRRRGTRRLHRLVEVDCLTAADRRRRNERAGIGENDPRQALARAHADPSG